MTLSEFIRTKQWSEDIALAIGTATMGAASASIAGRRSSGDRLDA